jgi:tRNA uridine 5-carboxymethylaminomethyl modification enzyme
MLHTLPGFEKAEIMRYAYAIEYDCADPLGMEPTLAFRTVRGLFGAGQFNGTSGYEEAAAQGLVAGINAALLCKGEEMIVLRRHDGYIGTLIDDLTHKGTAEPYRMMTSRSEYRLLLRQDNADLRLTPIGRRVGLVGDAQWERFCARKEAVEQEKARLAKTYISQQTANQFLERNGQEGAKSGVSLAELLKRPGIDYERLMEIPSEWPLLGRRDRLTVETDVKYEGYMKRQIEDAERQERLGEKHLPADIDYESIRGLRLEAAQKLNRLRPATLLEAQSISGVSPADITVLMIYFGIR